MQRQASNQTGRWTLHYRCNLGAFPSSSSSSRSHVQKGWIHFWLSSHSFASLPLSPQPSFSLKSPPIEKETLVISAAPPCTQTPKDPKSPSYYSHNHGYGKIVAISSQSTPFSSTATHLTDLRHKSPMRLVPSRRSHPIHLQNEPAVLHLSSYGGGLVPGDSLHLDIDVRGHDAVLCILTQGGQRIYRPGQQFRKHGSYNYEGTSSNTNAVSSSTLCVSTLHCTVEPGGTLLYLPDPTVPYHQSSFEERRDFTCQYDHCGTSMGSIIAVDWYSSGRRLSTGMEVERWAFDYLATRTELFVEEQNQPVRRPHQRNCVIRDSMVFDNTVSKDSTIRTPTAIALGEDINSMATLLLHGPTSLPVSMRANSLSHHLASLYTRTRPKLPFGDDYGGQSDDGIFNREAEEPDELEKLLQALGGRVLVSVTQIKHNIGKPQEKDFEHGTHMVRILAGCNEDVYRVLHYCLKPCSPYLGGLEPYRDRIYSSKTVSSKSLFPQKKDMNGSAQIARQMQQGKEEIHRRLIRKSKPDLHAIANLLIFGKEQVGSSLNSDTWFRLCHLSDSALPVGSFAHSFGVEAASQMKLFIRESIIEKKIVDHPWSERDSTSSCSSEAISNYIHAVSRSTARFSTPLILAGYSLLVPVSRNGAAMTLPLAVDVKEMHQSWLEIDTYANSLLLSNEPGRRASKDQGLGLLRIVHSFTGASLYHHNDLSSQSREVSELWELIRRSIDPKVSPSLSNGHAAPIYGILLASLGISPLDACRVFAFGAARDTVSAAVRLNLVGPMVGLSILDGVGRSAVEEGLEMGIFGMLRESSNGLGLRKSDRGHDKRSTQLESWLHSVATCAPVIDTVQPLHDLLSARLFRT
jgi:urease accessory protein UreF/urease accessory protein UreH